MSCEVAFTCELVRGGMCPTVCCVENYCIALNQGVFELSGTAGHPYIRKITNQNEESTKSQNQKLLGKNQMGGGKIEDAKGSVKYIELGFSSGARNATEWLWIPTKRAQPPKHEPSTYLRSPSSGSYL
ncbi:Zn-dependent exopeptidases superfamily protein [Striga asiatica]|uniref:Zn-dependent exopeptidases superfamily protein n=1 Tax=Striga asiatica TaxID=4170 RepID=A0A5A7RKL3_STRAF|nr:Zn-dependent exopeptidases superfamily protein [Striga asiatica]